MKPIELKLPEQRLCAYVKRGETLKLGADDKIKADVIRRLVLGLPFDKKTGLVATIASFFESSEAAIGAKTPVGISIEGGIIDGRLDLASAVPEGGGPICPLEFEGCRFDGGFAGAHGLFSRLAFNRCRFVDQADKKGRLGPTIDLSGAEIGGDFDMIGAHPDGIEPDSELPRQMGNHLWIRMVGARVDGDVNLCWSHLRAPLSAPERLLSEQSADALDLSLADVEGDYQFLSARSQGRIKIRTAEFGGDIWMSGSSIENASAQALLIQGTCVEGFLMMDGYFPDVSERHPFREFRCTGTIKLEAAEIGRSLYLEDAVVSAGIDAPLLSVRDDLILHAQVSGPIDLRGCRLGGSLDISELNLASSTECVDLKDGSIGRALKVARPEIPYEPLKARRVLLVCIPGLWLIETLWSLAPDSLDEGGEEVPVRRRLVQAAFLVGDYESIWVRIFHLDGHADVLDRAIEHYPLSIHDQKTAQEYARLCGAYVLDREGFFELIPPIEPRLSGQRFWTFAAPTAIGGRIERRYFVVRMRGGRATVRHFRLDSQSAEQKEGRRFRNGLVVPPLPREEMEARVAAEDWLARGALDHMTRHNVAGFGRRSLRRLRSRLVPDGSRKRRPAPAPGFVRRVSRCGRRLRRWWARWPVRRLEEKIAHHIESLPLLQARFDLEGLSCDMLDDCGGRAWGEHFGRIRMNHFVYRRANWGSEPRRARSSARYIWNRIKGARADWFWSSRPSRLTGRLREESDYLEPWQVRRNWIYRHFTPFKRRRLISISRYRIPEQDYRPQPFEQAIMVARAEGRDDYAVRFEMLKSRNEWRLFNDRARWWLGPIAVTVGTAWLLSNRASWELTIPAWALTVVAMVHLSWVDKQLGKVFSGWWPRRIAREVTFYIPALVLLAAEWWTRPFIYVVSLFIYLGIRFSGVLSHAIMWFGFGYLRRPGRAIVTLTLAFLLGWAGVSLADDNHMLVIEAAAVADRAAPAYEDEETPLVMGSRRVAHDRHFLHEPPCSAILSEPLYALDVLVPLVDLNQESRCEIRRLPERGGQFGDPRQMHRSELSSSFPAFLFKDLRFWWWAKAIYAIFGWILVSLAILTFAQVNKIHAEPPTEHK